QEPAQPVVFPPTMFAPPVALQVAFLPTLRFPPTVTPSRTSVAPSSTLTFPSTAESVSEQVAPLRTCTLPVNAANVSALEQSPSFPGSADPRPALAASDGTKRRGSTVPSPLARS